MLATPRQNVLAGMFWKASGIGTVVVALLVSNVRCPNTEAPQ